MREYYDYVSPNFKIRFGIGGDWFKFETTNYIVEGYLKNSDWKLRVSDLIPGCNYGLDNLELVELPYKTLVLFRKALAIKGLEYVSDKELSIWDENDERDSNENEYLNQ